MNKKFLVGLSLSMLLSVAGLVSCSSQSTSGSASNSTPSTSTSEQASSSSSSSSVATKLAAVGNLVVTHSEETKWTVDFDDSEHADKYYITVTKGDEATSVIAKTEITDGGTITAQTTDATYDIAVFASDSTGAYLDSDDTNVTFKVENWVDHVSKSVKLTGRVENDKPYGDFSITYSDGSVYVGSVNNDFTRLKGRHTYPNKMYYEGEFVNDNFEGQGFFSWSVTGDVKDGNSYKGQFKAGDTANCTGTFTYIANYDETVEGIMVWTGVQGGMGTGAKIGETGTGKYRFLNNSVYTGDLYKKDASNYVRKGQGSNIWTVTENCSWITGGDANHNIYGFVGAFDSVDHAWVYGNGVWYFKNTDGTPYGYVTGAWDGGTRTGAWADFDASKDLLADYANATNLTPAA